MSGVDELRPEYDLSSLRVRRLGPGLKSFGKTRIQFCYRVIESLKLHKESHDGNNQDKENGFWTYPPDHE